jgi:UDP-3-O-[3-hydroxymyristoyl] glucosamine N-acyltransferase
MPQLSPERPYVPKPFFDPRVGDRPRLRYRPSTYKALFMMGFNGILHLMARVLPGGKNLRPFLHRLRGVRISGRVFIGDDVYLDEDYPECIEIHDGAVIGPRCTIIGHTRGAGRIVIEKQAAIAAGCVIVCAPGQTLTIGEGAVISAGSTVSHDIPPYTLCGAPRIKAFGKVTVPFTMDTTYEEFKRGVTPMRAKTGDKEDS